MTAVIVTFPQPTKDGGKARILRRRMRLGDGSYSEPMSDLTQRHADPEEPYNAPPCDCA